MLSHSDCHPTGEGIKSHMFEVMYIYIMYSICTMMQQRRRRWADVGQMLCKCFVLTGNSLVLVKNQLIKTYQRITYVKLCHFVVQT